MEVEGYTISFNRGDQVIINVKNKANTTFAIGDVIKFSITKAGDITNVLLQKSFIVEEESDIFGVLLTSEDTRKICPPFKSGSKTYWYEIPFLFGIFVISVCLLVGNTYNPFIYFQF